MSKKDDLIEKASGIDPPSEIAYNEYRNKLDNLVININKKMKSDDDISLITGNNTEELLEMNHENHARFITSIMLDYNPKVLVETILWAYATYISRGFKPIYWEREYHYWLKVLKQELSPSSYEEIRPIYQFMLKHHHEFVRIATKQQFSS